MPSPVKPVSFLSVFLLAAVVGWSQPADWYTQPIFPAAAADLKTVDVRPLLQTACGNDARENGCSACPPGSADPGPGEVSLQVVTFGHFISATSEDALLSMLGCEPHSHYSGGSFLLTKRAGKWTRVGYHSRLITEQCHKLGARSGREMLVCSHYFGAQGAISRFLYLLDFGVPKKPRVTPLLTVWNEMRACGQAGEEGNNPVRQSVIDSVRFPDLNGDGVEDVSIVARTGAVQRSDADYKACQSWSNRSGAWTPPAVRTPAYRIDYVLRGKRLILTRRSVSAMKHFPKSDVF